MKKRFVLIAMMMMGVYSISAQFYVKPEAGMSSVIRISPDDDDWYSNFKFGLGMEYKLSKKFGVQTGAYYTTRTDQTGPGNVSFKDDNKEVMLEMYLYRPHYLQIPLMAKLYCSVGDEVNLTFAAGGYAAYGLGSRFNYSSYSFTNSSEGGYGYGYSSGSIKDWPRGVNRWDWGTSFAVGLEVKQWMINLNYDLALGKESKWDDVGGHWHTLSLTAGYKFKIGK